ncbi:MAG: hypothetical protein AB7P76_05615 [Candidatus Melainabacteria bacterium]
MNHATNNREVLSIHGSKTPVIRAEELPKVAFNAFEGKVPHKIAGYLRAFLNDTARVHQSEMLSVPSISELAMHLFSHEFDVLEALKTLERQGFKYYMQDLYSPVLITRIPVCHPEESSFSIEKVASQISRFFGGHKKQLSQA